MCIQQCPLGRKSHREFWQIKSLPTGAESHFLPSSIRFFSPMRLTPRFLFLTTALAVLAAVPRAPAADAARLTTPLPDPLVAPGGGRVTTAEQWTREQRPHVLELFRTHIYGRAPIGRPDTLKFNVREDAAPAFGGKARRKVVRISYSGPGGAGHIDATLFLPAAKPPAGCFVLIVNRARAIIDEAEAKPMEFWPVEDIVARGYATAAFHYSDVAADRKDDNFKSGVFATFGPKPRQPDSWGALAAWSWGASRVVDYLVTDPALAGKPIAVAGHSRGGKAALWCGAQDTRVALTISNDSGQGGAALALRTRGESVEAITRGFPYWFAENHHRFINNESTLPVDQHMLIALMAPRLVYVASARDDAWADPSAEFGSCVAAAPVFKLFGLEGVGAPEEPANDAPRHAGAIGHHIRPGGHNLLKTDWSYYMDFADRHWKTPAKSR
jgi:hypothetical protein